MKKRTGLTIAGGILEIIAGVYLLGFAIWALCFYLKMPNGLQAYNWDMLIIFACLIFFGILALVGRQKKDLISFGILNFIAIGFIIYRAIQTNSTTIIWLFTFEIILLVIASMFFFFTKRSEYEIVFNQRLKEYKEKEPLEHKKLKKILTIAGAIIVVSIFVLMLLGIAGIGLIGALLGILLSIGYMVLLFIIPQKNTTNYGLKANIAFGTVALVISFICTIFVSSMFGFQATSMTFNQHVQTKSPVINTYLYYYTNESRYLILEGINNDEETIYYATNGDLQFNTLPENSLVIIEMQHYLDQNNTEKIAYKFYNTNENKYQFYLFQDCQVVDNLPEFTNTQPTQEQTSNNNIILLISGVGAFISLILILGTKDSQLEFEVRKQLKEEENKKVYNQYLQRQ